ncbi:atrial natriuretic peptide receptor 1-like [Paramacrobiotus metropolitanus]|uniref:atrial natriuretic peptide receptor 1-like n=1 Tax=Paramacrobiotus metropolitanus TaxID=2943436 RepID=UPI0024457EF0|nr:atrial natriuretic peptide receptor 1-like [Paramacrobiotus metropolitanus]
MAAVVPAGNGDRDERKEREVPNGAWVDHARGVDATEIPHFMRQWNTLWISALSVSSQISDRVMNPTWIAVNDFSTAQCAHLYIEILTKFRWTTIYMVIDPGDPIVFGFIATMLLKELAKQSTFRYYVQRISTKGARVAYGGFESVLKDVAAVSRGTMITAERMGMTNGEYVYMGLETMRNKPLIGDFNWQYHDDNDQVAFRAYQSLLLIQPQNIDTPPNMQMGMEFIRRSTRDYNLTYNISDQLINESLSRVDGIDYQDGKALARLFLNHTYTDEYGSLYVDSTGQRRTDFVVTYFTGLGIRTPLLSKIGVDETLHEVTHLTEWGYGKVFPPPNEPLCGYLKNKCLAKSILGVFYWRYKKLKDADNLLHDLWWQLDVDDMKAASFFRSNASSLFTALGKPDDESVSASFKAERMMRFVSLLDKAAVCFPCARGEGSLDFTDISRNFNLLKLFKNGLNFVHHSRLRYHGRLSTFNCWIDKHFTLKLMHVASDRILGQLETVDNVVDCLGPTYCNWEPLFWLVPELDEIDQSDSAVTSMQAVDIFSSGLILYDILTGGSLHRKMQDMFGRSAFVTVDNARHNPLVAAVDFMEIAELASVIHACLSPQPEDRPSIKQLRSQLRELSPLLTPGKNQYKLFDKIYRQLCLYSSQLETEVMLRSQALREARRRCDALIRQFLPM